MSPPTELPESAESEQSLSAVGVVWVAAGLFILIAAFAFTDDWLGRGANRSSATEPVFVRELECTRATPRLPAEFVA